MNHIEVNKTIKLFIGGKFVRSESGRSFEVKTKDLKHFAHISLASRKDFREAVEASFQALGEWGSRSCFNRSQILYRMGEMLESKKDEFNSILVDVVGLTADEAKEEVESTIDTFIYYSGWADKYIQVLSSVNPINGPFGNTTTTDAMGVVAFISTGELKKCVARICSTIIGGNTLVLILDKNSKYSALLSELSEVFATSDLPSGVVNILACDLDEVLNFVASHMNVRALVLDLNSSNGGGQNSLQDEAKKAIIEKSILLSIDNLKRVVIQKPDEELLSLKMISDTVEYKTIWQSVGF